MQRVYGRVPQMKTVLLTAVLGAVLIAALYLTVRKFRRGGGCCGDRQQAERRVIPADRNRAHYPYHAELDISGMTCKNCVVRLENAFNALEGTWAKVDLNTKTAKLLLKSEPDFRLLMQTAAKCGYAASVRKPER